MMKQPLWALAKRLPRLFLEAYGLLFLISVVTTPGTHPLADESASENWPYPKETLRGLRHLSAF
jgi:hypothetical protein